MYVQVFRPGSYGDWVTIPRITPWYYVIMFQQQTAEVDFRVTGTETAKSSSQLVQRPTDSSHEIHTCHFLESLYCQQMRSELFISICPNLQLPAHKDFCHEKKILHS